MFIDSEASACLQRNKQSTPRRADISPLVTGRYRQAKAFWIASPSLMKFAEFQNQDKQKRFLYMSSSQSWTLPVLLECCKNKYIIKEKQKIITFLATIGEKDQFGPTNLEL